MFLRLKTSLAWSTKIHHGEWSVVTVLDKYWPEAQIAVGMTFVITANCHSPAFSHEVFAIVHRLDLLRDFPDLEVKLFDNR
jgi:predicted cupin superfamily sugar epimerase